MVSQNIQLLLRSTSKNSSPTMQRLCRVLKGPGCYICGLCGRRYGSLSNAWKCLTANTLKVNSHMLIASEGHAQTFQCLLCGKTYANQQDTSLCMIRDLENSPFPKVMREHLMNMASSMLDGKQTSKRDSLVSRHRGAGAPASATTEKTQQAAASSQSMNSSMGDDDSNGGGSQNDSSSMNDDGMGNNSGGEAASKSTGGPQENVLEAQTPVLETMPEELTGSTGDPMDHEEVFYDKPPEKDKPILFRTPGQKPFIRNNANYVCSVCNEKFFTKMDAENHFSEHPLVDTV